MAIPTRPVTGAGITTAWGQYVHDRALLYLGRGAIAVSATADVLNLATGTVFQRHNFTGTDKWDPNGLHNTVSNTFAINLDQDGLWAVYASFSVVCSAAEHQHFAGVSYLGGIGSAPLTKDQRSQRAMPSVTNRFVFGPWFVAGGGGGGNTVELWVASSHTSGTEAVDGAVAGTGELAAFLVQPVA